MMATLPSSVLIALSPLNDWGAPSAPKPPMRSGRPGGAGATLDTRSAPQAPMRSSGPVGPGALLDIARGWGSGRPQSPGARVAAAERRAALDTRLPAAAVRSSHKASSTPPRQGRLLWRTSHPVDAVTPKGREPVKITDVTLTLFAWPDIPTTTYGRHTGRFSGQSQLGLLRLVTDEGL